jgi:DNA polymerase III gamma/tau subunit
VADANLFPDEAGFTPRPAWRVIEAARRQYLTGELTLPTTPATKIFMSDGHVYFAERSTDGTLPIRLMMEGVITREQMQRATVIVNGIEHVGRMFDADPTIDRASVELCAELFTDGVMIDAANVVVDGYEMALYRRHPSGIDRWYPHSVPVSGRHNEPQATRPAAPAREAEVAAPAKPVVRPKAKSETTGEVRAAAKPEVRQEVKQETRQEVRAEVRQEVRAEARPEVKAEIKPEVKAEMQPESKQEVQAELQAEAKPEPKNKLNAPPITQAVPVTAPVGAGSKVPPPPITQTVPTISAITTQLPVTQMPPPTAQIPVTAPPSTEVDASIIADEVAEAIKRAFAGMGAGQ